MRRFNRNSGVANPQLIGNEHLVEIGLRPICSTGRRSIDSKNRVYRAIRADPPCVYRRSSQERGRLPISNDLEERLEFCI